MTYETVTCAPEHVEHVCAHLWERGVEEIAGFGLTPAEWRESVIERIKGEAYAILHDGVPVCVFGQVNGMTWFQATEAFTEHHREITKRLHDMGAERDLVVYSLCIHPRTEAWFLRCGYARDDWQGETVTGKPVYRFRRQHVQSI